MKRKSNSSKVQYGKLSRKDREFVQEFGHLQEDVEQVDELETTMTGTAHRVFDEDQLDRLDRDAQERKRARQNNKKNASELELDGDLEDWTKSKPSAYDLLLTSLEADPALAGPPQQDPSDAEIDDEDLDEDLIAYGSEVEDLEEEEDDDLELNSDDENVEEPDEESGDEGFALRKDPFYEHFGAELEGMNMEELLGLLKNGRMSDEDFGNLVISGTAPFKFKQMNTIDDFQGVIKKRIIDSWKQIHAYDLEQGSDTLDPLQSKMLQMVNSYKDCFISSYTAKDYDEIADVLALHSLNHVYKTRDRVVKNTEKLRKATLTGATISEDRPEMRDQGFTRPKVLIVTPFKNGAYDLIQRIVDLSGAEQQENKKRFHDEFGSDGKELAESDKPQDYVHQFSGNIDDCFRVGLKFSRKAVKFYSDFYSSDILVASPLGLRIIIGTEGEKKRDFDFLSSIEVVIMDQASVLLMQNWDHVVHMFEHLNLIPKESHDCDFSRIKHWYLEGNAKYLRQNIIMSAYMTPEINSLANQLCHFNMAGRVKNRIDTTSGSLTAVIPRVQHIFNRINSDSFKGVIDARFKHFTEKTLPVLKQSTILQSHTCIMIPSYFDFLKVKQWFTKQEISHTALSEYTSNADVSRARSDFFHGRKHFLLITERFHFFRRYRIRGVHNLVFYSPPSHAHFYSEFVNMLSEEGNMESLAIAETTASVTVLYSKFDELALERIVGRKRTERLTEGEKNVYLFA